MDNYFRDKGNIGCYFQGKGYIHPAPLSLEGLKFVQIALQIVNGLILYTMNCRKADPGFPVRGRANFG